MRNLKKALSILVCISLLASMFVGCSSKSTTETSTTPSVDQATSSDSSLASTNENVEIVWAGWSGEEESAKDMFQNVMIGSYNEKNNGTKVSWVGWPWAEVVQQLLIRTQGNEKLDIAQVDISMFSTLSAAGVLTDLTPLFGADYLAENFEPSSLAVGQSNGKQLGLPWSVASISMLYNPVLLKKAGWDNPPATVEEFEKCLADVSALGNDIIPYGIATKEATMAGDFSPWLWTFGGSIYDENGNVAINNDAGVKTVEWYQSLLAKNYIRMDISRFDSRQLFAQGKMAFYDDAVVAKGVAVGNGVDPAVISDVCQPMLRPVLKAGDEPQAVMWGHMLVVFEKSENKENAADFAKHLLSEEVAIKYLENNGMPPTVKSVLENDIVKNDPYVSGFIQTTKTGKLEEMALNPKNGEIKNIITEELQAALIGEKDAKSAVDAMAESISNVK